MIQRTLKRDKISAIWQYFNREYIRVYNWYIIGKMLQEILPELSWLF